MTLTRYCYTNEAWNIEKTPGWSPRGQWSNLTNWYQRNGWEIERLSNLKEDWARFLFTKDGEETHYVLVTV